MNKAQLVKEVERRLGGDRQTAQEAVDHVVDVIMRTVAAGEPVSIWGFGVFEKRSREARTARNPKTGASVQVDATSVPTFRPGAPFKEVVTGARTLDDVVARAPSPAPARRRRGRPPGSAKSAARKAG